MTPPPSSKVNIQALETLYLENLVQLDPNEAAKRFQGSDLVLDTKTGKLHKAGVDTPDGETTIDQEAAWVQVIRDADTNHDHFLDVSEVSKVISTNLPAEAASSINPAKFLETLQGLMTGRYEKISNNMKSWKSQLAFKPTLDALELYNHGILADETRHAHSVFPLNGLTKSAANIITFGQKGDQWAEDSAKGRFEKRQAAIVKLRGVIDAGVKANEPWALEGKLDEAMKKLDADTVKLLDGPLAATKLNGIITITDDKDRYQKLMDFAKAERPGFLGFGGGNINDKYFWNYTGGHNNLYFTRSVMAFLGSKAGSGDAQFDDNIHKEAREIRKDMLGDGGGFANLASVGFTNLFSVGGKFFDATPYRSWGDEDQIGVVGRSIDAGLMIFGGNKFLNAASEPWKLRGAAGFGKVYEVWRAEAGLKNLGLPISAWREARIAAESAGETLEVANKGRVGRFFDTLKTAAAEKLFKGLPPLNPEQLALLKKAGKTTSAGMDKLTRGVVLLGIAGYADSKFSAYYNPFDLDHEADFDRYPDPTKPDPALTKKK